MSEILLRGSLFAGPYKGYYGRAEYDPETGAFHGELTLTKDVITFVGRDPSSLATAFEESVDDYLEFCESRGQEPEKPSSGKFVVRMTPRLHRDLQVYAAQAGKSLNQYVVDVLAAAAKSDQESPEVVANTPGWGVSYQAQWQPDLGVNVTQFMYGVETPPFLRVRG